MTRARWLLCNFIDLSMSANKAVRKDLLDFLDVVRYVALH